MCEMPDLRPASTRTRYALLSGNTLLSVTQRLSKRYTMNSHHPNSRTALLDRTRGLRSMLAMVSQRMANFDGTQQANERRERERLAQLEQPERWELDQRVREVGEW